MMGRVKRALRALEESGRAPALSAAIRYLWYQSKNLRDLAAFPSLDATLASETRPADVEASVAFVTDRFGGAIRPIQNRWEITELARRVAARKPRTVLEIGTARGGTLFLLCQGAADDATIISLDLPFARNGGGFPRWKEKTYRRFARPGQTLVLLRGDSHAPESRDRVVAALGGRPLDFIMIDGDHSYAGVRKDFELYKDLLAPDGEIALHDILENRRDPSIDVNRFWKEVAQRYEHEEIVFDRTQGHMGIGVVRPARTVA